MVKVEFYKNRNLEIGDIDLRKPLNKIKNGNCTVSFFYEQGGTRFEVVCQETAYGEKPKILHVYYRDGGSRSFLPKEGNIF